jgi:hypothetical protein
MVKDNIFSIILLKLEIKTIIIVVHSFEAKSNYLLGFKTEGYFDCNLLTIVGAA